MGGSLTHLIRRYADWLHLRWPAGTIEALPVVRDGGATNVSGLHIAGDLAGVPLLKIAIDSGARAVRAIAQDRKSTRLNSSHIQKSRMPSSA